MKRCTCFLPILLFIVFVLPIRAQTARNVLIEEFTGTWCGYCPYGADSLRAIQQRMPNVKVLSYHNADQMSTPAGDEMTDSLAVGGFPTAAVDRVVWQVGTSYAIALSRDIWGAAAAVRSPIMSPMSISMSGFYDTTTAQLWMTIQMNVLQAMTGSYTLNFVTSEDSLDYTQTKYVGSNTLHISPFWHFDVVRDMSYGPQGLTLTTNGFSQGQKITKTVGVQFSNFWNVKHMKITAFVDRLWPITYGHRDMVQANQMTVWNNPSFITFVPVELEAFNAERVSGAVHLAWRASHETSNRGWSIERASDDAGWSAIAFVDGRGDAQAAQRYEFLDKSVVSGQTYHYRLRQMDFDGKETLSPVSTVSYFDMPVATRLHQNYPNPFNPSTELTAELAESGRVLIAVYDAMGRKVATLANGDFAAGLHRFTWNGSDDQKHPMPAGLYLCTMTTGSRTETREMILTK